MLSFLVIDTFSAFFTFTLMLGNYILATNENFMETKNLTIKNPRLLFSIKCSLFLIHVFSIRNCLNTGPGPWPWKKDPLQYRPVPKTGPPGIKSLPFVSCHMKSKGVQGLILVEITFEKYTTNFYFENDKYSIKTTIANLRPI